MLYICGVNVAWRLILAFLFSLSGEVKKKKILLLNVTTFITPVGCCIPLSVSHQSLSLFFSFYGRGFLAIPSAIFFFESLPWRWQPWEYAVIIIDIPASFLDCWPRFVLPWHNKHGVKISNLARRCIVRKHNVNIYTYIYVTRWNDKGMGHTHTKGSYDCNQQSTALIYYGV